MENNLEETLGSILSDPQTMHKLQAMARSLSQNTEPAPSGQSQQLPPPELSMVQHLAGLAGQTGIDGDQQALLSALSPYVAKAKISKLENAMRAAKMARLASSLLSSGGIQKLPGR